MGHRCPSRPIQPVPKIAEAGEDVFLGVQGAIEGGGVDGGAGVMLLHFGYAFAAIANRGVP